ncbi:hypothetical protein [Synechococcus sp. UW140]|uniref:hypothetical protein n=1 Tax=Synechococcus sp. UW140 TaxID=368503 RepID=UPI001482A6D5|nr:hypothetical protein [Synechococcus sp. UW140]
MATAKAAESIGARNDIPREYRSAADLMTHDQRCLQPVGAECPAAAWREWQPI